MDIARRVINKNSRTFRKSFFNNPACHTWIIRRIPAVGRPRGKSMSSEVANNG